MTQKYICYNMFAKFDYSEFPIVKVNFSESIENSDNFNKFLQEWLKLYENKINFTFIFNTEKVGYINPKYCILMSLFIKELKNKEVQYLKKSDIYVSSYFVLYLLDLIFYLQKPVAPVYIHYKDKTKIISV